MERVKFAEMLVLENYMYNKNLAIHNSERNTIKCNCNNIERNNYIKYLIAYLVENPKWDKHKIL